MPTDETPESMAAADESDVVDDGEADASYQEGYDAASDGRRWIRACLGVLSAEIDQSDFDPMSRDAVREMRVEAARRVTRTLRADREQSGPDGD